MSRAIRILLADDHAVLRQGTAELLRREPDLEVVGEAGDGQHAVELAHRLRPDIVVMDVRVPVLSGVEATRRIRASLADVQVLVLTAHEDRDRQLATLSATRVSEAVQGYARVLEALASNPDLRGPSWEARDAVLKSASETLAVFNAGAVLVDRHGRALNAAPEGVQPVGASVAADAFFVSVRETLTPAFSDVLGDARTGEDMIVIAVPILDDANQFAGALLGAIHLHNTPLGEPVKKLDVGDEGFAYLVDGEGRVIFHPESSLIGADFGNRPYVGKVIAGESGGALGSGPAGERLVLGYAPVEAAGWGLVVREPWEAVVAPARFYGAAVTAAGLAAVVAAAFLLWQGVRRIAGPVRLLAAQSGRLASGEAVEPLAESGILEIDALERAFAKMAVQIASYRAGLRRYVGAITDSQEEERRRLARDLHDETVQSLLAIARRLELYQASETDPRRRTRLDELQTMVADTLAGVRRISRDLRPLALEDLGLVPALRALVLGAHHDGGSRPRIRFEVSGTALGLAPEQELALYRITQEALANVFKHAQALQVRVELAFDERQARLEVSDDGIGFNPPASLADLAQQNHFGLMSMQERAWAAGGTLRIESAPGQGTRLNATLIRSV